LEPDGIPMVAKMETQYRIDKDSGEKREEEEPAPPKIKKTTRKKQDIEKQDIEKQDIEKQYIENPGQLNTKVLNTKESITKELNTKEEEEENTPSKAKKITRHKHGEYNNVLLSDKDLKKLRSEFFNNYGYSKNSENNGYRETSENNENNGNCRTGSESSITILVTSLLSSI